MEKINVGLIGLGRITDLHFPAYRGSRLAKLYAVCDSSEELALKRKKEWKAVKHYTDYREMLQDPVIDAVEVITPHALHEVMAVETAEAGKHVAVQKPMTISLESADRMIEAAKQNNIVYKVTDNYAFYPPIRFARTLIDNGEIGDPIDVKIRLIGGGQGGWKIPPAAWEWRIKENTESGGTRGLETFDHGHHLWTTAWILLGSVDRVVAWIDSLDGIIDAPSTMMWKYRDGTKYGSCEFVHAPDLKIPSKYYANDEWIEITGTRGIIFINRCTGKIHDGPPVSLFTSGGWKHFPKIKCDWSEGFTLSGQNFFRAIRGEEEPLLSGEQGREILRFSLAIQKSAKARREVFCEELDARFPGLYARRRIRKEKKEADKRPGIIEKIFGAGSSQYAPRAKELTLGLLENFDREKAGEWTSTVGLHLQADGKAKDSYFSLIIKKGDLTFSEGKLPEKADLVMLVPAGTWAAILMKKKRLETAFIQGKIKLEGRGEDALTLRGIIGI